MEACSAILKFEVLHCVNLPNADGGAVGTMLGKKTDAFVAVICDDNFAKTSVINNCLSPVWPPFTKRGFLFPVNSTSRLVHVGVFDSDEGDVTGGLSNDFIAKTTVDLSNLSAGVESQPSTSSSPQPPSPRPPESPSQTKGR
jgi:Ca2+-dependent lipid-binding protein